MTLADLPASSPKHPPTALLKTLRPVARSVVRLRWQVEVEGAQHVPPRGPVILASNHIGLVDGPLLAVFAPRPVHALTKQEMFAGRLGPVLRAAGQISLDRFNADPGAIKSCLRVLRDGGVAGVFPEGTRGDGEFHRFHHGAAYLALVTGAPVVPVTMVGTRPAGGGTNAMPDRTEGIHIVFGRPWRGAAQPWPRTREHVLTTSALLWDHLRAELEQALARTQRSLPGPLPAGQSGHDPDTGFLDQTREQ